MTSLPAVVVVAAIALSVNCSVGTVRTQALSRSFFKLKASPNSAELKIGLVLTLCGIHPSRGIPSP